MARANLPNFTKFIFFILLASTLLNVGCKSEEQASSDPIDQSTNCDTGSITSYNVNCENLKIKSPFPPQLGEVPLVLDRTPYIYWYPAIADDLVIRNPMYATQAQVVKESDNSIIYPWTNLSEDISYISGIDLVEGQKYFIQLRSIDTYGKTSIAVSSPSWTARIGKGKWNNISLVNAPPTKGFYGTVWTGTKMVVWGGQVSQLSDIFTFTNVGGIYDPETDTWSPMSTINAPEGRSLFTTIWTGSEMIVWGGPWHQTGGRYNPTSNTWRSMSTVGAPVGVVGHRAVWTGSKMIVWGGQRPVYNRAWTNTGAIYDPATDSWSPVSNINAPAAREGHAAVWTGSKMIIWGGGSGNNFLPVDGGGIYDPASNTWSTMSINNEPTPVAFGWPSTGYAWDGSHLIIQKGGGPYGTYQYKGGSYDIASDSWTQSTEASHPFQIDDWMLLPATSPGFSATTWIDSGFFVWGGIAGTGKTNTGGIYNPVTDSWIGTSLENAPAPSIFSSSIWTGKKVLIWGDNVGASYTPE